MHEIGAADDADHLAIAQHRKPLDAAAFHQFDDRLQRIVLADGHGIARHDFFDLAAGGVHIFVREAARPDEKFQPFRPPALRCRSRRGAENRPRSPCRPGCPASSTTGRPLILFCSIMRDGVEHRLVGRYGNDVPRHDITDLHDVPHSNRLMSECSSGVFNRSAGSAPSDCAARCAAKSALRSLRRIPGRSVSAKRSRWSGRDNRRYPGATSAIRRRCRPQPRSAISRRKLATRSCALLTSSRMRSCIRRSSRLVRSNSSRPIDASRPASAVSALRLTTSTFVSAMASAEKVCSSANCKPENIARQVKSADLAAAITEDFVGADAAADDLVNVVGRLVFAENLGVARIRHDSAHQLHGLGERLVGCRSFR